MNAFFISILNGINGMLGNYGWSVILFTILIRLVLSPFDYKSRVSMRRTALLQPKIAEIQKKYAKDQEKMNQKMSELYRKEKVNPMSSCLPMLLTWPILIFMFNAMREIANQQVVGQVLQILQNPTQMPTLESWLWIKNVWMPDSPFSAALPDQNMLSQVSADVWRSAIQANPELWKGIFAGYEPLKDLGLKLFPAVQSFSAEAFAANANEVISALNAVAASNPTVASMVTDMWSSAFAASPDTWSTLFAGVESLKDTGAALFASAEGSVVFNADYFAANAQTIVDALTAAVPGSEQLSAAVAQAWSSALAGKAELWNGIFSATDGLKDLGAKLYASSQGFDAEAFNTQFKDYPAAIFTALSSTQIYQVNAGTMGNWTFDLLIFKFSLMKDWNGLYLLPLMSAASQLLMTKLNPAQPQPTAGNDQQKATTNFMTWFFPLFTLWICSSYNGMFALYWVTSNIVAMVETFAINKYLDNKEAAALPEKGAVK